MATLKRQLYPLAFIATISTPLKFGEFTFKAANGAETVADSATLVVPANRHHKNSGTVSIPIVRFRGTTSKHTPVIYISGGTGSGIASAAGNRFPMFLALREAGDVITFDLRGSARSLPHVACSTSISEVSEPMTYDALTAILSKQTKHCADSLRASGVDLGGHNIREVVEDIDAIRQALGAPKIILVGISTGSQIALEYLRRHEVHTERVVIAGVQAPDQNVHMPADQETVVQNLNLVTQVRTVFDSLTAHRQHVTVKDGNSTRTIGLGPFDLQLLVSSTLGDRRQIAFLSRALGAAAKGDYTILATMKLIGAKQGITSAFESLMDCQTGAPSGRAKLARTQAETALLGRATLDFPEVCAAWGVPMLEDSYRKPVRSRVPTLLISGSLDGRTPIANAEDAMRGLPNSSHLVIAGASHGDDLFLSSPQIVPTILEFLGGKSLPKRIELSAATM